MDFARLYSRVRGYVDRLVQGENLRAKTTRGAALLGGASLAEQASRFARNMLVDAASRAKRLWDNGHRLVCLVDCRVRYGCGVEGVRHSKSKGTGARIPQRGLVAGDGTRSRCLCHLLRHGSLGRPVLRKFRTLCVASRGVTERRTGRGDESTVLPTAERYEVRALGCNQQWRRRLWCHSYGNSQLCSSRRLGASNRIL